MKKKYKWMFMSGVVFLCVLCYAAVLLKSSEVETEQIVVSDLMNCYTAQGTLLPAKSQVLNAVSAGEVSQIPYHAGDLVSQGEVIVQMGSVSQTESELQREQFLQQVTTAKQEYERLYGEQGIAAAQVSNAKNEFELMEKNYTNALSLYHQNSSVSQMELETLKVQMDQAKHNLEIAEEANSGTRRSYHQELIQSYERQLETIEETVKPESVTMPYRGVLWEIYPESGAFLLKNQPVAKVYDPKDMKIQVSLLSEETALLEVGDKADIRYADGTETEAEVFQISMLAQQQMSTIGMEENRCLIELKPIEIPRGMGAGHQLEVSFQQVLASQVLTVPASALVFADGEYGVYQLSENRAMLQIVEVGAKSGGRVEIISGLQEDSIVIKNPYEEDIKNRTRVKRK